MADYPSSIYSGRGVENVPGVVFNAAKKQRLYAEDINQLADEITAIETILGTNPNGAYDTVKDWLTALAAGGGGGTWGSITGDINDQTDLQTEFATKQDALGFTPEDVANKKTTMSGNTGSNTFYLSAKAIYDWATATFQAALGFTPEDVANKSTNTSLGTSNTLYPSQNAVKSYVDTQIAGIIGVGSQPVYYGQTLVATASVSTKSLSSNTDGHVEQFFVPNKITVNQISLRITSPVGSPKVKLGIFSADGSTRLWTGESGTISAGTITITQNLPITLTPGVYYMMVLLSAGTSFTYGNCVWVSFTSITPASAQAISGTYATTAATIPSSITLASITEGTSNLPMFRIN